MPIDLDDKGMPFCTYGVGDLCTSLAIEDTKITGILITQSASTHPIGSYDDIGEFRSKNTKDLDPPYVYLRFKNKEGLQVLMDQLALTKSWLGLTEEEANILEGEGEGEK